MYECAAFKILTVGFWHLEKIVFKSEIKQFTMVKNRLISRFFKYKFKYHISQVGGKVQLGL